MRYGALPRECGTVDISPTEMLYWMYCPVSLPGRGLVIPDNLRQFMPILRAAWNDDPARFVRDYVYLTAKRLWVSGDFIGNRPGWHADGFGTNDINYIWYDREPTEFLAGDWEMPDDCADAMEFMRQCAIGQERVTFEPKTVLRLDASVIHRSPDSFEPGYRTFVKVSISPDRYNLEGNSVNHLLGESWPTAPRQAERNHPHQ